MLTPRLKKIVEALRQYQQSIGDVYFQNSNIVELLGYAPSTTSRLLKELIDLGYVEKHDHIYYCFKEKS